MLAQRDLPSMATLVLFREADCILHATLRPEVRAITTEKLSSAGWKVPASDIQTLDLPDNFVGTRVL